VSHRIDRTSGAKWLYVVMGEGREKKREERRLKRGKKDKNPERSLTFIQPGLKLSIYRNGGQ
jgi:hypothetical protein